MKQQVIVLWSLVKLAAKRIWNLKLLMLSLLIGLITGVGVLSSIPLYADAAQNRILQGELTEGGMYRPPFAFMWRYVGAWNGNLNLDQLQPVDDYLSEQAAGVIGLDASESVKHLSTGKMRLFAGKETGFEENGSLIWADLGFVTGLEERIHLVDGAFPAESADSESSVAQVIIGLELAEELGVQVGERFTLVSSKKESVLVQVSGIWTPSDPTDPFWFYPPESFKEMLLTTEPIFRNTVAEQVDQPVGNAVWYQILDGRSVRPGTVRQLLTQIQTAESRVNALLNGTTLDASPVATLQSYSTSAGLLILTLSLFSLPIFGLVIYFVTLIAGMVVRREESEIAILRSRGITRTQIFLIYLLEGVILGGVGIASGLYLGKFVARLMGRTQSFLDLNIFKATAADLVTVISPTTLGYAAVALAFTLLALLIPALRSSRNTIVTLRGQQSRDLEKPGWQRYFLDFFLLLPALYGWYQLDRQNGANIVANGQDPFSNPLLFLVPVFYSLGLGLIAVRIVPVILQMLAGLATHQPSTTLLITLRQLARSTTQYIGPLLLLTFTLSLATFTSSMASTLDTHLHNRAYYETGADLNLTELGEKVKKRTPKKGEENSNSDTSKEARWLFLPVTEHLTVDGVQAAARVGDYSATANIGDSQQVGRILGIDRIDFAKVAYFRPDFAGNESLGGVLNRLAVARNMILVNRSFMEQNSLQVGDPLIMSVEAGGKVAQMEFVIAAPLDYFPTLYTQDGPFFVAHLDYLYEQLGGQFPYNVWIAKEPGQTGSEVVQGVRALGLNVVSAEDAQEKIRLEQGRPERQGLFGLLSVGFSAAALLTVLGFAIFAVVSFQRRYIELGMLRAIGLSMGQMALYLAGEQITIILTGMGLGTALGYSASVLFIPFFQVGRSAKALVPPFVVQIAWDQISIIYAIFGVVFVLAVAILLLLLRRMKVFEAIKLGETL